jgi:long-chain acyl-CoA synthetase
VEGAGHVPAEGPFVVVANHVSDLDPGLVGAALPGGARRRVWWGGDRGRLFGGRVRPALARAFRVFPVDERSPGVTIAMARSILARGDALVWFPESWRSPDGSLQRFLPGIGLVLDGLDVPVVPALIQGAFEAMPRNRRLPRPHPIRVTFGPPVAAASLPAGAAEKADRLRALVGGLAGGG